MPEMPMEECPYRDEETAFVAAIDTSLLRDAVDYQMNAHTLLGFIVVPLGGMLRTHLDRCPRVCFQRMVGYLQKRMDRVSGCPEFSKLLSHAVEPYIQGSLHPGCVYCDRDVKQYRGKLPRYQEFYS